MERLGQNQRRCVCFDQFARWRHRGGKFCCLWLQLVYFAVVIVVCHIRRTCWRTPRGCRTLRTRQTSDRKWYISTRCSHASVIGWRVSLCGHCQLWAVQFLSVLDLWCVFASITWGHSVERLKTYLFHKSYPPPLVSLLHPGLLPRTIAWTVSSKLLGFCFYFSFTFVSGPCASLCWPSHHHLSAH